MTAESSPSTSSLMSSWSCEYIFSTSRWINEFPIFHNYLDFSLVDNERHYHQQHPRHLHIPRSVDELVSWINQRCYAHFEPSRWCPSDSVLGFFRHVSWYKLLASILLYCPFSIIHNVPTARWSLPPTASNPSQCGHGDRRSEILLTTWMGLAETGAKVLFKDPTVPRNHIHLDRLVFGCKYLLLPGVYQRI